MAINNSIGSKPLTVPEGGTGQSTLTQNGILLGQGTSAVVSLAGATNGDLLIGATGIDPDYNQIISSDGSVTVTPGVNSVTLSAASAGALTPWTPTLNFNPVKAFAYTRRTGLYIQVGNLIYWSCDVIIQGNIFPSTLTISGLPGNYDLAVPRYYFPMNGTLQFSPNAAPWPQAFGFLDTATGLINLITNEPSTNNALWTQKDNVVKFAQFFSSGFYFTN